MSSVGVRRRERPGARTGARTRGRARVRIASILIIVMLGALWLLHLAAPDGPAARGSSVDRPPDAVVSRSMAGRGAGSLPPAPGVHQP